MVVLPGYCYFILPYKKNLIQIDGTIYYSHKTVNNYRGMSIVFRLFKKVFSRELEKKIKEWYLKDIKLKTYAHMHINGFLWYVVVVMTVSRR